MAQIKPFMCIRPESSLASRVAALPYDVYNSEEAKEVVVKEPLSFLKVDRAETCFEDIDPYDDLVYQKARELIDDYKKQGVFLKDEAASYYIYQLTMDGRKQTGIVACASIDDYIHGVIKKHENTRSDKELDRIKHVEVCNAQTGPIFLAYRSNASINRVVELELQKPPIYDFVAEDGIRHSVWKVADKENATLIENAFSSMKDIYIADGHHRAAAAVKVGTMKREEYPNYTGKEEFNYFLSVLFPDDQLLIMPYNRCIKDLNGNSEEEYISKIKQSFEVEQLGKEAFAPQKKGEFGMYLSDTWYRLTLKPEIAIKEDPVSKLDVSILHRNLIEPIHEILNPKVDKRIDFIGGIRGLGELEQRVHSDMKVAFSMYPTAIQEVFAVSDAGLLMPPKSTWFEPKLRSGLFIHEIS